MNNFFYSKLAVQNLKNNRKTYVPYILTCIFTTAMFFVVGTIANIKWAGRSAFPLDVCPCNSRYFLCHIFILHKQLPY